MTCLGSKNNFIYDQLGFSRMLFQIMLKNLSYGLVNGAHNVRVAKLGFSLSFKLRLCDLYGNHRSEPLPKIISTDIYFYLIEQTGFIGIIFQRTGKRAPKTSDVRTTLMSIDIIDIGNEILTKRR